MQAIYEHIRDEEGFSGSYGSVKDYARPITRDRDCFWEYTYDLLISLEKKHAIDFLFLLSSADPPAISPERTEQFFRDAARIGRVTPNTDAREQVERGLAVDHSTLNRWVRA